MAVTEAERRREVAKITGTHRRRWWCDDDGGVIGGCTRRDLGVGVGAQSRLCAVGGDDDLEQGRRRDRRVV